MSTEPNKSEFLPRLRLPKIPDEDTKGEFLPRLRIPKIPDEPPPPEPPVWATPPGCPRCGRPLSEVDPALKPRGDWMCLADHDGKTIWFNYELTMILRSKSPTQPEPQRWTPAEREAIDRLKAEKDMSEPSIIRQALRCYQMEHERKMGRVVDLGPKVEAPEPQQSAVEWKKRTWNAIVRIGRMCEEGRPPSMSIPVRPDVDDDMVIVGVLKDSEKLAEQCEQLRAQLADAQAEAGRLREALEGIASGAATLPGYNIADAAQVARTAIKESQS